jgi:hypothetical protein
MSWFNDMQKHFDKLADDYFGGYANAAKAGAKLVGPGAAALGTYVGGYAGFGAGPVGIVAGGAAGAAVGTVVGSAAGAILGVAIEKVSLVLTDEPLFAPGAAFP